MVVEALSKNFRRAITSDNLIEDFGYNSNCGVDLMQDLTDSLIYAVMDNNNPKIKMLFEEWKTLYGQVADISKGQLNEINK